MEMKVHDIDSEEVNPIQRGFLSVFESIEDTFKNIRIPFAEPIAEHTPHSFHGLFNGNNKKNNKKPALSADVDSRSLIHDGNGESRKSR